MAAEIGGGRLWSSRPIKIIVRRGDEMVAERTLDRPFARVGAHAACEVVLAEAAEADCQLYLHATDAGIYCLGLSPGTPNGWLSDKNYAALGDYRVYARFADGGDPPTAAAHDLRKTPDDAENRPRIVVRGRRGERLKHRLPGRLALVGRNQRSTIRIDDDAVSNAHCVLFWDGHDLWAVDLLSAGGTVLNGHQISAQAVPAGEELLIGNNRIHWRPAPETPVAVAELRAQLAESERRRQNLDQAMGEREAEIERLTAALQAQEPPSAAGFGRRPVHRDAEPPPATVGQGLLGEELIERLLDFKTKRERGRFRRGLLWAAVALLLLLFVAAVVMVLRPWLFLS